MRRRLLIAILALVAGTVLVSSVSSLLLIRRASDRTAEQQLYTEARALAVNHPDEFLANLSAVTYIGRYQSLVIAGLSPTGRFTSNLPISLREVELDPRALLRNRALAGDQSGLTYVLIPLTLSASQRSHLRTALPSGDQPVLVATRAAPPPVAGVAYFVVVGLVCVAAAGIVAWLLAARFSRPIAQAAAATVRIADGDLDSPISGNPSRPPELAALSTAINAMAERLRRARDQQRLFLQSVSHELRTPLTSIRGYAEALLDGTADDVPAALGVITSESERLDRLVQDLIDLSRLEADRFPLANAPVDLEAVARRAVASVISVSSGVGVVFENQGGDVDPREVSFKHPFARVLGDEDRLAQVAVNLIENGARFALSQVTVTVSMPTPRSVDLAIEDDGPGIDPGDLDKVFEPHFSTDRASSAGRDQPGGQRRRGSGLGLAIVSELVGAMGGTVAVTSPVSSSGGTRFVVTFPQLAP